MASIESSATRDGRLDNLQSLLAELLQDSESNESLRKELFSILQDNFGHVESPADFVWRMMLQPHQYGTLRTALEMRLPHILAQATKPLTAEDLSKATGAEKLLIGIRRLPRISNCESSEISSSDDAASRCTQGLRRA